MLQVASLLDALGRAGIVTTVWVSDLVGVVGIGLRIGEDAAATGQAAALGFARLLEGRGCLVAAAVDDAGCIADQSVAPLGVPILDLRPREYRERGRADDREGIGLRLGLVVGEVDRAILPRVGVDDEGGI